jgi:MFS family permease
MKLKRLFQQATPLSLLPQGTRPVGFQLTGVRATAAVAVMIAVMFMASTILTPLYVLYEQAFGFSRVTLTLIYGVYVVGNVVALLFFGRLSDQIGRRPAALPAMAAAALSALAFLFATDTAWLFVARALTGLAVGIAAAVGTAWIAELDQAQDKSRATVVSIVGNFAGLGAGPLFAGVLAEYAPWPLRVPFISYLAILTIAAVLIHRTRETVVHRVSRFEKVSFKPRLGVPEGIRMQFVAPAATVFSTFALSGVYFALLPSILSESLHIENHAVGGAIVCELAITAAACIVATRRLGSRTSMSSGLALLLPSLAALVVAQAAGSVPILLLATALSGVSGALGYRGSLQVVNQIAPPDRRAEVTSTYFLMGFLGNSLPVVGIAVLAAASTIMIANVVFAITIAALACAALVAAVKYRPPTTR